MRAITLNFEALISADINKRLLFQQANSLNRSAVIVINTPYFDDAAKILNNNIIAINDLKQELLLSHKVIVDTQKRNSLAKAYFNIDAIGSQGFSVQFISGLLQLLDCVAINKGELIPFTLGRWQTSNNKEIIADITNLDLDNFKDIAKRQRELLKAIIYSLQNRPIESFKRLIHAIWKPHSQFLHDGRFDEPLPWQEQHKMILLSAAHLTSSTYAKIIFDFAMNNNDTLLIDSEVPEELFLSRLLTFNGSAYISVTKLSSSSKKENLGFWANKLYMSMQAFDPEYFLNWLAHVSSEVLADYTIADLEQAAVQFKFDGYRNSFLTVENKKLILYRIDDTNTLVQRDFDFKPLLQELNKNEAKVDDNSKEKADYDSLLIKLDERVDKWINETSTIMLQKIEQILKKQSKGQDTVISLSNMLSESDAISADFERVLEKQRNMDQ